jgi:hypothetical protein
MMLLLMIVMSTPAALNAKETAIDYQQQQQQSFNIYLDH